MGKVFDQVILDTNTYLTNFSTAFELINPVDEFIAPSFRVQKQSGRYVEYDQSIYRIWDDKIIGNMEPLEIQYIKLLNQNLSQDGEPLASNVEGNAALKPIGIWEERPSTIADPERIDAGSCELLAA